MEVYEVTEQNYTIKFKMIWINCANKCLFIWQIEYLSPCVSEKKQYYIIKFSIFLHYLKFCTLYMFNIFQI